MMELPPGLFAVAELSATQRAAVEALVDRSRAHEGQATELFLVSPSRQRAGETNHFLYTHGDTLVGILALSPGGRSEATGLVDPAFRRRGIGRTLIDAARGECRRRGATELLLTVDAASLAGVAFAAAVGAEYRFAEHCLEWEPPPQPPRGEPVALRPAGSEQIDTLVRLDCAAFDDPETEVRDAMERWLCEPNQRFFIGWHGDEAVGMIRADLSDGVIYLATFGVLPEFRRRGFGRRILEQTVRTLLPAGKPILLEVETDNDNALSLYLSCGFRTRQTYRYYELPLPESA